MTPHPKKLGIIAGGGALPQKLLSFCDDQNISPFVIGFHGHTAPETLKSQDHVCVRLGAAGQVVKSLRAHRVHDLVFIGHIKRPSFWALWPDFYAFLFYLRLGFRVLGDNSLLTAIRDQLSHEGFTLHGIHEFLPELLMPEGNLGSVTPTPQQMEDIRLGFMGAKSLGADDIGQSVLVLGGKVIAREGKDGTNAMIRRHASAGSILVKACKPQQERRMDLPTIGVQTIILCAEMGCVGVAVESGAALIVNRDECVAKANEFGLFIIGVAP